MRGLGGFVLLAGIGVGLFVYFPAPVDRDTSLEQANARCERVASSAGRKHRPRAQIKRAPSRVASFSPGVRLTARSAERALPAPAVAAAPELTAAAKVEAMPSVADQRRRRPQPLADRKARSIRPIRRAATNSSSTFSSS